MAEAAEELSAALKETDKAEVMTWFGKRRVPQPTERAWLAALGFIMEQPVGRGFYTRVREGRDVLGTHGRVAVKILALRHMDMCSLSEQDILMKCDIWMSFKNSRITKVFGCFVSNTKIYWILEFACKLDLQQFLLVDEARWRRCIPHVARKWCWQVTRGIAYIHGKGFAHENLKLENVLLNCALNVKLSDFGMLWITGCTEITRGRPALCCSTKAYAAPELLRAGYTENAKASDMWAVGVIFFGIWNRSLPFPGYSPNEEILKWQREPIGGFKNAYAGSMQDLARKAVLSLLQQEITARPTIITLMKHPLFTTYLRGSRKK